MIKSNYRNAFCEVLYILENMDGKYLDKIPKSLLELFKREKSRGYKVNLLHSIPLEEQELLKETRTILAFLCRKYLCDGDSEY